MKTQILILACSLVLVDSAYSNSNICNIWPNIRDSEQLIDFDAIVKNYDKAYREKEIWIDELNAFSQEYSEGTLKAQAVYDILLLGANLTAQVLGLASGAAGIKTANNMTLEKMDQLKNFGDIIFSNNKEEAAYKFVANKSNGLKYTLNSFELIKSLLDAKERFSDRKSTIALLQKVEKTLRKNIEKSKKGLKYLEDFNSYKNEIDAKCNSITSNAESCISSTKKNGYQNRLVHVITNTCTKNILVFWCYSQIAPYAEKPCGTQKSYFVYHRKLAAGQSTSNYFSMPGSVPLELGACYGSYSSVVYGQNGSYYCKISR